MAYSLRVTKHDIWSGGVLLESPKGLDDDFLLGTGEATSAQYPAKQPIYGVDLSSVTKSGPGASRSRRQESGKHGTHLFAQQPRWAGGGLGAHDIEYTAIADHDES